MTEIASTGAGTEPVRLLAPDGSVGRATSTSG